MSQSSERVVVGFIKLSSSEQNEVIKAIEEYQKSSSVVRQSLFEGHNRALHLGPTSPAGCPCCGR